MFLNRDPRPGAEDPQFSLSGCPERRVILHPTGIQLPS